MTVTVTHTLPSRFFDDWRALADEVGESTGWNVWIVKRAASTVTVEFGEDALADLRARAEFYVASAKDVDPEARGLVASARATLRRLDAPVKLTESQHRLLASIRDHEGDVWEGWRLWKASRRVNPGGAEPAFAAIMRKGLAESVAGNVFRLTEAGERALAEYERPSSRGR